MRELAHQGRLYPEDSTNNHLRRISLVIGGRFPRASRPVIPDHLYSVLPTGINRLVRRLSPFDRKRKPRIGFES